MLVVIKVVSKVQICILEKNILVLSVVVRLGKYFGDDGDYYEEARFVW